MRKKTDPVDVVEDKSPILGHSSDDGVQDSLSLRITPRFHAIDEGDTVTSWTVTGRSM